jgi:nucleotide-binding universal stress UspA family protein
MAFKSVLVPIHKDGLATAVLGSARTFAKRYGCHLEGIPLDLTPPEFLTLDMHGGAWVPAAKAQTMRDQQESRELFEAGMREGGIAAGAGKGSGATSSWSDRDLAELGGIAGYARAFDMTIYGRCAPTGFCPHRLVLESTLFESGRPILISPPSAPMTVGDNVVIAWNCSTESARTVALAMPLIEAAKRVTVLTVEGGTVEGPTGRDLARGLEASGIAAQERTVPAGKRSTGVAILEEAAALGCDLLIKGAYTQSRLRQMIFGGATSHILGHAEVPVVMAN